MKDRLATLESTVASLVHSVHRLESRIAALEPTPIAEPSSPEESPSDPNRSVADPIESAETRGIFSTSTLARVVSLLGRSFLVLAGAFLLRAVTDAGTLPAAVGVGVGLVYASAWIGATAAAARRGRQTSAAFHATCSAIIAYPLIWEAVRSFQVLSPGTALPFVAVVTGVGLWIARLQELRFVAWVFTVAAVIITVSLLAVSSDPAPASGLLVAIGIATLWLSRSNSWPELPWLPAIVADVAVERVVAQASSPWAAARPESTVGVHVAVGLAAALVVGYLGSVAIQVLWRRRSIHIFDMVQTAAVLAAGVGGAIRAAGNGGAGWIGFSTLAAGALCYWASFTVVERTFGRGREFVFFSTLALALILIGTPLVFGGVLALGVWAILAVGAAIVGGRYDRVTLRAHAAVLAAAAAIRSGLAGFEVNALTAGSADGDWLRPTISTHLVLGSALACLVIVAWNRRGHQLRWPARLPLVVLVVVAAAGLCAEIMALLAAASILDVQSEAGIAALRTAVISIGALVLAVLAVRLKLPEFGWLVYPILVMLGLKIVLQDLPVGGPLSIAVAFVFYGAALIMGPRLLRTADRSSAAPEATE